MLEAKHFFKVSFKCLVYLLHEDSLWTPGPGVEITFKVFERDTLEMKGGSIYRNEIDGRLSGSAVSFPGGRFSGILRDYATDD